MGDTVTNHDLLVCTKGTGHKAQTTGDTDVCFNPPKLVPSPHPNWVSTKQLGAGQTTKTFIQGKPIVTMAGTIEPASKPAHADTGGGVVSGTYCLEAKPTGGSPDVSAEGNAVCRTTDPTTQNHANTTGTFVQISKEEQLAMEEQDRLARCTIVKVVGECFGQGSPDFSQMNISGQAILSGTASAPGHNQGKAHDRHLYFPPNSQIGTEGFYLEVMSTDTVTLTATRENAVEKGAAVCSEGIHTRWVIKRSGGGEETTEEEVTGKDVLILDEEWFQVPSVEEWGMKPGSRSKDKKWEGERKPEDVTQDQKDKIRDQVAQQPTGAVPPDISRKEQKVIDRKAAGERVSQKQDQMARARANARERELESRREAIRAQKRAEQEKAQKPANKSAQNTLKVAINAAQNAAKIYYYWNYMNNPVTLEITAFGCSGAKNVKLVCYPVGKFEFDLFSDKIAENVAKIQKVAQLMKKIADWFGKPSHMTIFKGPQLLITTEYKELTKDHNGLLKSQVNRWWELSIGFEKMIEIFAEFGLPLLNFFGPMGSAANLFLNALGIEGNAYISVAFAVNPRIVAKWTEYNEMSIPDFKVTVKVEVQIGARARWRDIAEIYAAGYLECSIEFVWPKIGRDYLFRCTLKGSIQIGVKAGGYASWWGFSKSFEINYKPPDWKYVLGEGHWELVKLS